MWDKKQLKQVTTKLYEEYGFVKIGKYLKIFEVILILLLTNRRYIYIMLFVNMR